MIKIPTIFQRDESFYVVNQPVAECSWVFQGEGTATEKLDGTNIRLTIRSGQVVRIERRRNPRKAQRRRGIIDGWYVDANAGNPANKWIIEAVEGTKTGKWPDGEHQAEALGPKIQGNPLELDRLICVPFDLEIPHFKAVPRDFKGLSTFLLDLESRFAPGNLAEGIVFHHPDGRRAKIKRKDFAPDS